MAKLFALEISIDLIWGRGAINTFKELPKWAEDMAQYLSTIHVALGLLSAPPPQTQPSHAGLSGSTHRL